MATDSRLSRWVPRLVIVGVLIPALLLGMVLLALQVSDRLRALQDSASDNAQWVVLQSEVETLKLMLAVAAAQEAGPEADLAPVRQWFDILYSRMDLIRSSETYGPLLEIPEFSRPYSMVETFLIETAKAIDGPGGNLRDALPPLAENLPRVRDATRRMTLVALAEFAAQSEERRTGIQATLVSLAVLTGLLILAMAALLVGMLRQYRMGQRQAREVEAANLRLETIIKTSADAIVVTNRGGWIVEFNPAAERIFGYAREEVVGRNAMTMFFPPELDELQRLALARRAIETADGQIEPFRIELDVTRKDGARLPVEVALAATGLVSGSVAVAFVRDISDRRQNEDALREARDRALAGERAKADFIAVMSHEMRTPLNGLLGSLALLDDAPLRPDQRDLVSMMRVSGKILLDHVNSVLDLSRVEALPVVPATETFDADLLMEDCLLSQAALATAAGNRMSLSHPAGRIGRVRGDAQRLRQVLLNFLSNAVKFTRDGAITLEAERHPPGPGEAEGLVEFRVIDTGDGIAEADLERVFEDFVTLDTSYGRRAGGTGLGLAISRRLAGAMGGTVGVESEPGEGSLFWLRVPMPRAGGAAEVPAMPAVAAPAALSVLVIEDNRINRVLAVRLLEGAGHRVVEAEDGRAGLALSETRAFDLILTDISMPGIDGVEVARRIRSGDGPSGGARIVALTAHALPQDRQRFRAAGIDDCLIKPVTETMMARAVARAAAALPAKADAPTLAALSRQLGPSRLAELVAALESEGMAALAVLAEGPPAARIAACHRLAGSSAGFGLLRLADRLRRLETALRGGNEPAAAALAEGLPEMWRDGLAALKAAA
ncbi:PAS domain-containing hybrid sensor histidine kinase/response regulator [Neotabrizicola shimadae]|uniref:histidine kinase n=1 Tax=Neotabrizicola shimadae TaxID=2807096 RepID=A0A8G0ZX55_9RHOB|nr:PAS domain-containing hybrid sensor histidine kinase/response regulator [Neotabrizicola shimadae]QYZ70582.1 PAS domain S-box protein [Neotabrizicola shimadae]